MTAIFTRIGFSAMSAIVAAGIVAFADPANAAPVDPDVAQRVVSYADLNLSSTAGRATFDQRVAAAADQVCPATDDGRIQSGRDACREQAIDAARRSAGLGND